MSQPNPPYPYPPNDPKPCAVEPEPIEQTTEEQPVTEPEDGEEAA